MENKSSEIIEILTKMRQYISEGAIGLNDFPKKNIMKLVHGEYQKWLTKLQHDLDVYIASYDLLIDNAIEEQSGLLLLEYLSEMTADLQSLPADISAGRMDRLQNASDPVVIKQFQKNAKIAWQKYPYRTKSGESAFHGKGVVYTVITGGYDVLREPEYVDKDFDYICFTDNKQLQSEVWTVRYLENPEELDRARLSRKPKILFHEFLAGYDYSIYVDGKIQIIGNLREYIATYSKGSPMLCFPHHVRRCAYEEAKVCTSLGLDKAETINAQMDQYRQEGYPVDNGLIDAACMVRSHQDKRLQSVMECWWQEVKTRSRRDQLSMGYACWKNQFHYDLCDLFIYQNEYICKRRDGERVW